MIAVPFIRRTAAPVAIIVAAALAAYANTFHVPFLFDDVSSIVDNPTIRQLWPPGQALSPPSDWGFTVSGRPVLNYSFALNYAVSGVHVWSYHAFNLLIHIFAGLLLFGLVRRTLGRPPLAAQFGEYSRPLALVIAALWTLHPLQTESVTYVAQRAESLMGLFFLLTFYAFARSLESPRPGRWRTVSFVACLLGVGTKEVTVLAPLLVFFYDRTFVAGGFRAAWQHRRWVHLSLAATWLPLAVLLATTGGNRGGTAGFNVGISWTGYWLTQFEAITRYLALSLWPHPQIFDYGKIVVTDLGAALWWAIPVAALVGATLLAVWRWPVAGFLGAWFFTLLAPTSVVPGTLQMIVEHRMYLPLAAVVAFSVGLAARWFGSRSAVAIGAGLALVAGLLTIQRNQVYRDETTMWQDVLAKRPANARAQNNLGLALYHQGKFEAAVTRYRESVRLDPSDAHAHYNLGLALMSSGHAADAIAPFAEAIRILPYFFSAHLNLGIVLAKLGRPEDALPHFMEALRYDPSPADTHFQLGVALAQLGRWPEAIQHYAQAVELNPSYAEAHSNWGVALVQINSASEAVGHFEAALRINPDLADAHFNLGLAYASLGRSADALAQYLDTVRLNPQHVDAQLNLGIALAQAGKLPEAIGHLEQAVQLRPDSPALHTNLATALVEAGRATDALSHYEITLRLRPGDAQANYNVGYALLAVGRGTEAKAHFENALRLQPGFAAARDMLRRLQVTPSSP